MIGTEGAAPQIVVGIHRPIVMGRRGVVATGNHLATLAGMKVLMDGGNAVDAAVTAAGVLAVVMPQACGIGGDAFLQVYDAKSRKVEAINGSGVAPALATLDRFPNGIPQRGVLSASVPGAVDAWATALARHGTISLKDALQPAIFYAEEGFPLTALSGRGLREQLAVVKADPGMSAIFLKGGEPLRAGRLCVQRDLGRTLRLIADQGRDAFYGGEIAHAIERFMAQRGGFMTRQDLAAHATQVREPVRSTYRGLTVTEQPPVSVGVVLLEALNILEGFDLASLGHNSPEAVHLQVEALRLAFADRDRFLGDPDAVQIPVQALSSKAYAASRRALISRERAAQSVLPGEPDGDTTYLCVVDGQGNAVSFIQSVFVFFGAGVVVDGTGIILNNRMIGFSLTPGHPNCLAPGRRTAHTLNTYMLFRDGELQVVGGTPGGVGQIQTNVQIICNLVDFGLNVQQTIEAPRWLCESGLTVAMESRMAPETVRGLEERGHQVRLTPPWHFPMGGVQAIVRHPAGDCFTAGADPRREGYALAW